MAIYAQFGYCCFSLPFDLWEIWEWNASKTFFECNHTAEVYFPPDGTLASVKPCLLFSLSTAQYTVTVNKGELTVPDPEGTCVDRGHFQVRQNSHLSNCCNRGHNLKNTSKCYNNLFWGEVLFEVGWCFFTVMEIQFLL